MKNLNIKLFCILLLCSCFAVNTIWAQELIDPMLAAKYTKLSDGSRKIDISLLAKEDRKMVQIEGADIHVYILADTARNEVAKLTTNYKGETSLKISADKSLPVDKLGNSKFIVVFAGNSKYNKSSVNFQVKNVFLDIQLSKDSSKTISAFVYELNAKGEKVFIKDVDLIFNVKRLFCLYPIGTGKTDQAGNAIATFPSDMPGDTSGKVSVVVRIQDSDTYANVEKSENAEWGKHLVIESRPRRGLGDTDAPLWMVYTLLVLLSGVWLHFMYIIFLVFRINRIGKKLLGMKTK